MYATHPLPYAGTVASGPFCLECDVSASPASLHSAKGCPVVRRLYPKEVALQLPQLEAWMAKRLGRVQTLDRARAWLKACVQVSIQQGE